MLILNFLTILAGAGILHAQTTAFAVVLDQATNGAVTLDPELPANGKYAAGTVVTVTARPNAGYALDSIYYSARGRFGAMYHESMSSPFKVTIDQEKHVGASFIESSQVAYLNVVHDVVYAKPGVKALKYDVYSPKRAKNLPCIVIIHGGGWAANDEDIMRGMARELTKSGKYVVFSIDYRWAQKADGDAVGNSMANLIEDVFGAIAHIMENAAKYGADPTRIALTGDSAGGHLSAAAANMADHIGKGGFGKTPGVFEFMPSYLPKNKTLEQVRTEMMAAIKAAAPSYGVFAGSLLNHYSDDPAANDAWKDAIRGTNDSLIKDEAV
jgi:acetyl esterase